MMIRSLQSSLIVLGMALSLASYSQNTRVEKDEFGEIKVPSSAYYGINTARAMKFANIEQAEISDFPNLIKMLGFVKLAAIEANLNAGEIEAEKAMMINRACKSITNGGYLDAFKFGLHNGGQGYFENAAMNEVLANLSIEMSGSSKGNYKTFDPEKLINLNQNYPSVYQTSLNLTVVSQNEALLKELESFAVALNSYSEKLSDIKTSNGATPIAMQLVKTNFEKSKDSLGFHITNLQMGVANLKFHTMNGSSNLDDMTNTGFQNQISSSLLKSTGMNFNFQNNISALENQFESSIAYMKALANLNLHIVTVCKLIQALDGQGAQDDPLSFSTINRENAGPIWGHVIPGMVIENCLNIDGRFYSIQKNISPKKKKSIYDVNRVGLETMVSQYQLIKALKLLRKNLLD